MSAAYWLRGDTRQTLAALAAAGVTVDLVVTSPPFLNLRSYLPAGDPDKALEMGSEPTPGAFIDGLLDVTEACEQILAPHGSICVELGDTRAGSGGAGGDYNDGGLRNGQPAFAGSAKVRRNGDYPARDDNPRPPRTRPDGNGKRYAGGQRLPDCLGDGWPAPKSHALIPEIYRIALAYGYNPLTGRTTPRWRVRNVVTWCRPNPPVGADGDKFRPATSDIAIACRTDEAGRTRYWDGDAVRTPAKYGVVDNQRPNLAAEYTAPGQPARKTRAVTEDGRINSNPAGAPLLDWWKITGSGYPHAHYATYPTALVEPLVKAMCPLRVCTICGEPSRRIVREHSTGQNLLKPGHPDGATKQRGAVMSTHVPSHADRETVGWTDCGHGDNWRPGIVLDPFAGSGTTLAVATGHARTAIGIDLDRRNIDLARDRVGGLLFHEVTVPELAQTLTPRTAIDGAA